MRKRGHLTLDSLYMEGRGRGKRKSQERQSAVEERKEGRSHCTVCCSHRRDLGQNAELTQCVSSPRTNKCKTEKREMQVAEVQKSRSAKWAEHKVVHTLHTSSLEEIPLSAGSSQLHTPACSSYNLIIIIIIIIIVIVITIIISTSSSSSSSSSCPLSREQTLQ